jgi:hypothetical protein
MKYKRSALAEAVFVLERLQVLHRCKSRCENRRKSSAQNRVLQLSTKKRRDAVPLHGINRTIEVALAGLNRTAI